ncbi:MAG: polysaccharide biosynthesis/export family protein [Nitrospirae bacterium]|nr:polysaccharide biosynthesis/export family protein [Nitrospirota bacterium]
MIEPEYGDNTLVIKFNEVSPKQILKEKKDALEPQNASQIMPITSDYFIGDEDMLQISVWGNPELGVHVPVRPDGRISVPLVGDVRAAGVTPQELKAALEKEFTRFVKAPTVSVIVTAVNSFKVYILGEGVTTSGAVTLKRNTTLMQQLAQFGSLKNADLNNSHVLRDGQKLNVDFYKLIVKGDVAQDIRLKPNDVIFIPDNFEKRITVVGAVKKPTVIPYREGMTVLDAILSAGDFTEFAKQNDVVVVRKEGSEVRNIEVRLKDVIKGGEISKDIPLKPGDLIIVKTGIF